MPTFPGGKGKTPVEEDFFFKVGGKMTMGISRGFSYR
jgi:hypothetical protein